MSDETGIALLYHRLTRELVSRKMKLLVRPSVSGKAAAVVSKPGEKKSDGWTVYDDDPCVAAIGAMEKALKESFGV